MIADGAITMDELHEFTRLNSAVSTLAREARRNMEFAFERSQPLQVEFAELSNQAVSQASDYVALVQAQVLQSAAPAIVAPLYFDRGTEAISSAYRLLKMTTEHNRTSFEQDIAPRPAQKCAGCFIPGGGAPRQLFDPGLLLLHTPYHPQPQECGGASTTR
jgi:hypothetical protein